MQQYTFNCPARLLFAIEFAQIALVVTEKAAFEDTHVKGFMPNDMFSQATQLVNTQPSPLPQILFSMIHPGLYPTQTFYECENTVHAKVSINYRYETSWEDICEAVEYQIHQR